MATPKPSKPLDLRYACTGDASHDPHGRLIIAMDDDHDRAWVGTENAWSIVPERYEGDYMPRTPRNPKAYHVVGRWPDKPHSVEMHLIAASQKAARHAAYAMGIEVSYVDTIQLTTYECGFIANAEPYSFYFCRDGLDND